MQRDQGQTTGRAVISGTYTGGLPNPEVKITLASGGSTVVDWTAVSSLSQSNGLWSGRCPAVNQSSDFIYKYQVRCAANHALTQVGTGTWGVGDIGTGTGQSNMNNLFATPSASPPIARAGTAQWTQIFNVVTISSTNPGVVNWNTAHGFSGGERFFFQTNGVLPTNVTAGQNYYILVAGITATTFEFSLTPGGTPVDTTAGTQSGAHVARIQVGWNVPVGPDGIINIMNAMNLNLGICVGLVNASIPATPINAIIGQWNDNLGPVIRNYMKDAAFGIINQGENNSEPQKNTAVSQAGYFEFLRQQRALALAATGRSSYPYYTSGLGNAGFDWIVTFTATAVGGNPFQIDVTGVAGGLINYPGGPGDGYHLILGPGLLDTLAYTSVTSQDFSGGHSGDTPGGNGRYTISLPNTCSSSACAQYGSDNDALDPETVVNWSLNNRIWYNAGLMNIAECRYSHTNMDCVCIDGIHYNGTGTNHAGQRYGQAISYYMGGVANPPSWYATAAAIQSSTVLRVTLVHSLGTDFTPTSGIVGFEVSGDGHNWIAATGARVDATHVDLTHSALNTNVRLVRHLYNPFTPSTSVANIIHDNSSIAVPLNFTPTIIGAGTTPYPLFMDYDDIPTFSSGVCTYAGQYLECKNGDTLVWLSPNSLSVGIPTAVVATPIDGLGAIPFTKIVGTTSGSIWQAVAPRDLALQSCPMTVTVGTSINYGALVVLKNLSSSTPVALANSDATYPTVASVTPATSAGGVTLACCRCGDSVWFTGTETFANCSPSAGSQATWRVGQSPPSINWGFSINDAGSGGSTVTVAFQPSAANSYTGVPSNGTGSNLQAVTWR